MHFLQLDLDLPRWIWIERRAALRAARPPLP